MNLFVDEMKSAAGLSDCGRYRYWLTRTWDKSLPVVCFVMLNPSTADAHTDDPTIRRCIGFAKAWSCGGISVVNLFAWRAADPDELPGVAAVGPENDTCIIAAAEGRDVIAAWGAHMADSKRAEFVTELLKQCARSVECLGYTATGRPRHPLYLKSDSPRLEFPKPK